MTLVGTAFIHRGENENLSLSVDVLHKTPNLALQTTEMGKSEKRKCFSANNILLMRS